MSMTTRDVLIARGEAIKQRRIASGMTQAQLAESVGCATQTISNIETGRVDTSTDTLVMISVSLGCTYYALSGENVADTMLDDL